MKKKVWSGATTGTAHVQSPYLKEALLTPCEWRSALNLASSSLKFESLRSDFY